MKVKPTTGIISILLGVLTALIPIILFPVCTDKIELLNGKSLYMKCHWTAMSVITLGIFIVSVGILLIIFKKFESRLALSIVLFLLGLGVLLMATVIIGMCATATMQCRIGTEPALIVTSIITMLSGIGNALYLISSNKKES